MEDQNLFLDNGGQEELFHLNYIDEKTKADLRKKNFILTMILYVILVLVIITLFMYFIFRTDEEEIDDMNNTIELKYNVNYQKEKIKLFDNTYNMKYNDWIEWIKVGDKKIDITNYHIFEKEGEGKVIIKFKQNLNSLNMFFDSCYSLKEVDLTKLITDQLVSIEGLFNDCTILKNINFGQFNTKSISNMSFLFHGCSSLSSLDLGFLILLM